VRGIIYKDGKLFLQRLKHHDGQQNEFWSTPGGGIDDGEDIVSCLVREMIEETGVRPQVGRLLMIQQFHDGEREQLEFFFHIENADDYEEVDLTATSHGDAEVAEYGFVDITTTNILPAALVDFDYERSIDSVQPVAVWNKL